MKIKFEIDNSHKVADTWTGEKTQLVIPHENLLTQETFVKSFVLSCWGGPNRCVEITYIDCESDYKGICYYKDQKVHGVKQNYTMFRERYDDFFAAIVQAIKEDLEKIYSI